ncbi:hypothetical protein SynBIOSE41_01969 [Synechococcus sp. BIOS-E4-1]|nr:hypothetical protein SynBIOSE41_01969 [Synechococcus sp. BIOS-E4-1]
MDGILLSEKGRGGPSFSDFQKAAPSATQLTEAAKAQLSHPIEALTAVSQS